MSIAFVRTSGQITTTSPLGGGSISLSITPPAVGNTVLVAVATAAATGAASCSDASGATYTLDAEVTNGLAINVMLFSVRVTTAGVLSIKINGFGASLVVEAAAFEFSGIKSTSRFDTKGTGSGIGTSVSVGPTTGNLLAGDAWIAIFGSTASLGTFTAEAGATGLPSTDQTGGSLGAEYKLNPTIGSKASATGEFSTTGTWAGLIAAYRAEPTSLVRSTADASVATESLTRIARFSRSGGSKLFPSVEGFPATAQYPGQVAPDSTYLSDIPSVVSTFHLLKANDIALNSDVSSRIQSFHRTPTFILFPTPETYPELGQFPGESLPDLSFSNDQINRTAILTRSQSDESNGADAITRIQNFPRSIKDNSLSSDIGDHRLLLPRSGNDETSTSDVVSSTHKNILILSDNSASVDTIKSFSGFKRTTGDNPLDPEDNLFPGNVFPGNQTSEKSKTLDGASRFGNLLRSSSDLISSTDTDSRGILHFVRVTDSEPLIPSNELYPAEILPGYQVIGDKSKAVDSGSRLPQNFVRSFTDFNLSQDIAKRASLSLSRNITDVQFNSETNKVVRTLFRSANDSVAFITVAPLSRVMHNMGYLIWDIDAGNILQSYTGKNLKKEPINELKIFEGKIFPRSHVSLIYPNRTLDPSITLYPNEGEPDVFSYQLTSHPLSVNQPRQQTVEI